MDEDTFQTNLHALKEMILDENKIVTYVSLGKDLCIHINDSKHLLAKFVENIRKEHPDVDINVSYIVSGLCEDNKARTAVISEKDRDHFKNAVKLLFYEHVYSVSKGLPIIDNAAYLSLSKFEDLSLCIGLIKNPSCIKHTSKEISNLKSNSLVAVQSKQNPPNSIKKKIKDETNHSTINNTNTKSVTKVHETKSEPALVKTEVISPKKDTSYSIQPKHRQDNKKNGTNKTQKGIEGFFNKSNSVPNKILLDTTEKKPEFSNKKQEISDKKQSKSDKKTKEVEINKLDEKTEDMDVEEEVELKPSKPKPVVKKETINGKAKNKSINNIKKTAKVDKKRKRVLEVSDSESEDEIDPFKEEPENHESEDEIPPTPAINTIKITSGILNPRKRRKIVDKTYTDEDGYILTKKVEVYESCSDEEETKENDQVSLVNQIKQDTSPQANKNGPKISKKKISPPQKGKQATLMNFFKKV